MKKDQDELEEMEKFRSMQVGRNYSSKQLQQSRDRSRTPIKLEGEDIESFNQRVKANQVSYHQKALARKAEAENELNKMITGKPEINPMSKKIIESSLSKQNYVQIKVEDRLTSYGNKLKDTKDLKRLELNS